MQQFSYLNYTELNPSAEHGGDGGKDEKIFNEKNEFYYRTKELFRRNNVYAQNTQKIDDNNNSYMNIMPADNKYANTTATSDVVSSVEYKRRKSSSSLPVASGFDKNNKKLVRQKKNGKINVQVPNRYGKIAYNGNVKNSYDDDDVVGKDEQQEFVRVYDAFNNKDDEKIKNDLKSYMKLIFERSDVDDKNVVVVDDGSRFFDVTNGFDESRENLPQTNNDNHNVTMTNCNCCDCKACTSIVDEIDNEMQGMLFFFFYLFSLKSILNFFKIRLYAKKDLL